jgi:hypothetical protein
MTATLTGSIYRRTCGTLLLSLLGSVALAQQVVDPGFRSVGRGAPLSVAMPVPPIGTGNALRTPGGGFGGLFRDGDIGKYPFVGPMQLGGPPRGGPSPPGAPPPMMIGAAWNGAVPAGVQAMPIDIFTSKDFYKDRELWKDKRYFRCNSPQGLELQRGAIFAPTIGSDPPRSAAWGYCDRDLPRSAMVSPYGFKTAQEHYDALMAETTKRGGPTQHTYATVPGEISGMYAPGNIFDNWYSFMAAVQFPTVLSLLTPEYQTRLVQDAYHQGNTNAPQWVSQYCWPEGFMRRWYAFSIQFTQQVVVSPNLVQIMAGVADNFITNIHVGRKFRMDGNVPRLGPDVPRWMGETIGFWDKDALITWTSNVQGWSAHGAFEFSSKMQTIEIYTPIRDASKQIIGLNHEAVFYDPEALVEPIRIIRNYQRTSSLDTGDPIQYIKCIPTIMPVKGHATAVAPGQVIEYEVPDMYGRPWAKMWEKYFEQGMQKPKEDDIFDFSK